MNDIRNPIEHSPAKEAADWVVVALSTFLSLVIYSLTTNPGVDFYDSAELALQASLLGATHAPGAPVHTLLGFMLSKIFSDPVTATNLLSMVGGSFAAGMVCLLLLDLTANRVMAFSGALIFALIFPVWGNSVVTETYSPSLFILACCIYVAWHWRGSGDPKTLLLLAALYGLGLGAHFASIILLPAFIFLVGMSHSGAIRNMGIFLGAVLTCICAIAYGNFLLTTNVPPFGQVTPDTLGGLFLYMSGSEHDPLKATGIDFYIGRILQHAVIFSRHYLFFLVPAGLLGLYIINKRDWTYGGFLTLIFILYMGYFTLFGPGDYDAMVGPAYLVFSLWVVTGVLQLTCSSVSVWFRPAGSAVLPLAAIFIFVSQFPARYADAASNEVEKYVEQSFALMPEDSIVVAGWREFTVLNYYQQVYAFRPDLTIILPARGLRHYSHGEVSDYRPYISERICDRPVVSNKLTDDLVAGFVLESLTEQGGWHRVLPRAAANCAAHGS